MTTDREFQQYRRSQIAELRPWQDGDDMRGVSVSAEDRKAGSPKPGDMIARNPKNHADQWLVAAAYFADNFEPRSTLPREGQPTLDQERAFRAAEKANEQFGQWMPEPWLHLFIKAYGADQ